MAPWSNSFGTSPRPCCRRTSSGRRVARSRAKLSRGRQGSLIRGTGRGALYYYYRARYYDPGLKRFISEDPIGIQGGSNIYAYVKGEPISSADPDGLRAIAPPPRGGRAPRTPKCVYWRCVICVSVPPICPGLPSGERCTTFYVTAPPGHPGEGGFFGPGGYAGDAAK
ncbi:MAG: RHS repeat-associated core domain-containing protein, partial [Ardenticatenaceae bacterium]